MLSHKNGTELANLSHVVLLIQNTTQIPFYSCVCIFYAYIKYMCIYLGGVGWGWVSLFRIKDLSELINIADI